jgi:hypothetical protein
MALGISLPAATTTHLTPPLQSGDSAFCSREKLNFVFPVEISPPPQNMISSAVGCCAHIHYFFRHGDGREIVAYSAKYKRQSLIGIPGPTATCCYPRTHFSFYLLFCFQYGFFD